MIKAAKAAKAVRKPVSTFIPRTAAPEAVGVVLVSELVVDAAAVVRATAVVGVEVDEVTDDVEPAEEVDALMLNWLD